MKSGNAVRWARVAGRVVAGLLLLILGYAAAGTIGGAIPANPRWRPPARGIEIFVEDNGIHTGLILPKVAAGVDWRGVARPGHLSDPRYAAYDHLAFGWGEHDFYLGTPTWADVSPRTVLRAAIGSDMVLMHVDHLPRPHVAGDVRRIVLRPAEYRRLAAFIRAGFAPGGRRYPGYGAYDAFYQGRGHYSAIRTCNAWTGDALRVAGVRVGAWTPFSATVMQWFGTDDRVR